MHGKKTLSTEKQNSNMRSSERQHKVVLILQRVFSIIFISLGMLKACLFNYTTQQVIIEVVFSVSVTIVWVADRWLLKNKDQQK
jgi:hypothetical protein